MIYCIILIFVIFSHKKLSVGFSSALKRNWKGIGIDKKELELLFFIPKELELELELNVKELELNWKQGKSEGFDSCDRPSNLTQIGFKSSIFQPVWPWNLMDDPKKQ